MVSYEHQTGLVCGTVSGEWRYSTVRASTPKRQISLRDLYTDEQILRAFLDNRQIDKEVWKAIDSKRIQERPLTLRDLTALLTKFDHEIFDGFLFFEEDYLTRFAFHRLEGDAVAIWVSLSSTSTAGRAQREHVEICLPVPEALRNSLEKASTGEQGFLMKDHEAKVGTTYATFESSF